MSKFDKESFSVSFKCEYSNSTWWLISEAIVFIPYEYEQSSQLQNELINNDYGIFNYLSIQLSYRVSNQVKWEI